MSVRSQQWISWFLFCLAGAITLAAAYSYFAPPPSPALHVAETEIEMPDAYPGQEKDIVFRLDNRSGKPIRILGQVDC